MSIGVVGINYKSSPLEIREELAKAFQFCFSPRSLQPSLENTVLLSTCNRTEVYFSAPDLARAHSEVIAALREFASHAFEQKLYSFFGLDCFMHLAKVAAGLDSAILAETEIQSQVRCAYLSSSEVHCLPAPLHYLFQKTLKISKATRCAFPLPRGLPTLESVLFELIGQNGIHSQAKVLLIGNSQVNRQIIGFFQLRSDYELTLSTQSEGKEKGVEVVGRECLQYWRSWDVVICATNQGGYLLRKDQEVSLRRHLLIDLSVPRLIDPMLARDPHIHLLNMEQIAPLVDGRRRCLLQQVGASQAFLEEAVHRHLEIFQQKFVHKYACMGL